MSFASKYNYTRTFNISTEGFPYRKLKEAYNDPAFGPDAVYPVDAVYIHEGKYGESASVASVANRCFLSLPNHQVNMIKAILGDQDAIQDIKNGRVGCRIVPWSDAKGNTFYKIEWVDIELPY